MIDEDFSLKLIKWYNINKRDLPWRKTNDPYKIWISEIVLQQTRVDQGLPYYLKFVKEFPKVQNLADASEDKVLKLWQGLGYYSRARNLHFTSKLISNELKGKFPENYDELLKLKGVGEYTASAIASFAFNEQKAVLDGNVFRVLSRYYGVIIPIDSSKGKKIFSSLAYKNLPKKNYATYNQSIMEFGALQCKPSNPDCAICPINIKCWAFLNSKTKDLPCKEKKIKVRLRYFNFIIIQNNKTVIMEKRLEKDIWRNLYQFPLFETSDKTFQPPVNLVQNCSLVKKTKAVHKLTHQKLNIVFWHFKSEKNLVENSYVLVQLKNILKYPVPKIVENFIAENITNDR
jgi:A/G-specific adenine glycosylase